MDVPAESVGPEELALREDLEEMTTSLAAARNATTHSASTGVSELLNSHLLQAAETLLAVTSTLSHGFGATSPTQSRTDDVANDFRNLTVRCIDQGKQVSELLRLASKGPAPDPDQVRSTLEMVVEIADLALELVPRFMIVLDLSELQTRALLSRSALDNLKVWRLATDAATAAATAADAAAESAGKRSAVSLANEFEALRDAERRSANGFRWVAISLYGLTVGIGGWMAIAASTGDLNAEKALLRLGAGVPVLALAAYLGHEGNVHRRTAAWASVLVAQLKSIRAYSQQLSPEGQAELMSVFGHRVFLESPNSAPGTDVSALAGLDVVAIMREAGSLAGRSTGPTGSSRS